MYYIMEQKKKNGVIPLLQLPIGMKSAVCNVTLIFQTTLKTLKKKMYGNIHESNWHLLITDDHVTYFNRTQHSHFKNTL